MTQRLYRDDPLMLEFNARVERVEPAGDCWKVELDRTAFFPEGGGQPADHGTLDAIPVTNVQEEGDHVLHFITAPLTQGRTVHGVVSATRRRDFMQQHTGQHIISAAFWKEASLVTQSVHMGEDETTIDLDVVQLTDDLLEKVMRHVDAVIAADMPLNAVEATPEDLPRFTLRKPPPVKGTVRLVRISDFDCVGCCGLHLPSTGPVRIAVCTGWERMRGQVRTHWQIGDRAAAYVRHRVHILNDLREQLATRDEELVDAVRRRMKENADLRGRVSRQERRLADYLFRDLLDTAQTAAENVMVARVLEDETPEVEKTVVKALLAAQHCAFALINVCPDRLSWTLGVPPHVSMDFRAMKPRYLDPLGARGGGRSPLWQGSAPANTSPADLLSALKQILETTVQDRDE